MAPEYLYDSGHAIFQIKDQSLCFFVIVVVVAAFFFNQLLNVGKFHKKRFCTKDFVQKAEKKSGFCLKTLSHTVFTGKLNLFRQFTVMRSCNITSKLPVISV